MARAVPLLHVALIVILLCALRAMTRFRHSRRQRRRSPSLATATGQQPEHLLLIGVNSVAELFMRATDELSDGHMQVVGLLSEHSEHRGRLFHGKPVLATPEKLQDVLAQMEVHGVDIERIVITVSPSQLSPATRQTLREIEDSSGTLVDYFAERLSFTPARAPEPEAAPAPDLPKRMPSLGDMANSIDFSRPYWRAKRVFDVSLAFLLLVLTAPVMLAVAVAVAIDVGVPVVFWQQRLGRFGRRLRINKFRTMRSAHDSSGNRIPDDSRLSAIGRFLRRSRLDELPQLFHILIGDMSFIGPRPLLFAEQGLNYTARLAVRPGLSGWAQVHGGRTISLDDKVAMDLWYIRHAGFRLDLLIALKTLKMVVEGDQPDEDTIATAWQAIDRMAAGQDSSAPPPPASPA